MLSAHKITFIPSVRQVVLMVRRPRCVNNIIHKKFLLNFKGAFPEENPDWSPDSVCSVETTELKRTDLCE